ncbi:MAG: hypothetical protein E6471_15435, partial [Bradyrhizobium sp.]|nr:hypothetical protein [Bradyrhizobium sp.]
MFEIGGARRIVRQTTVLQQRQRRTLAGGFRGIRTGDAGTVAGEIDAGNAAATGGISLRQMRAVAGIEAEGAAGEIGGLCLRAQIEPVANAIAGHCAFASARVIDDAGHPALALNTKPGDA